MHPDFALTAPRVRAAVARAVGPSAGSAPEHLPVARLAGHASMRSYWRVGAAPASWVVMVSPPGAGPEELGRGGRPDGRWRGPRRRGREGRWRRDRGALDLLAGGAGPRVDAPGGRRL